MSKIGVLAFSADPITNGHLDIIVKSSKLFDKLFLSIGVNADKKPLFTLEERIDMLNKVVAYHGLSNIEITSYTGKLLVHYATEIGANYIVRGIRNTKDFEYEMSIKLINEKINPIIETIYLFPPRELAEISSSIVKGLVGNEHWEAIVAKYVPGVVLEYLRMKAKNGES